MSLDKHWSDYLNALGKSGKPASSNTLPFPTSSNQLGVSGFLDLTPKQPEIQARYDAMSLNWEGVSATEKAIFKGDMFKPDSMPVKQNQPNVK